MGGNIKQATPQQKQQQYQHQHQHQQVQTRVLTSKRVREEMAIMEESVTKVQRVFEQAREKKMALESALMAKRRQLLEAQMQTQEESLQLARNGAYVSFIRRNFDTVYKEYDAFFSALNGTKDGLNIFFQLNDSYGKDFDAMKQELAALCVHKDRLKQAAAILKGACLQKQKLNDDEDRLRSDQEKERDQLDQIIANQTVLVASSQESLTRMRSETANAEKKDTSAKQLADYELRAYRQSETNNESYNAEQASISDFKQKEIERIKQENEQGLNKKLAFEVSMKGVEKCTEELQPKYRELLRTLNDTRSGNVSLVTRDKAMRLDITTLRIKVTDAQEARERNRLEDQSVSKDLAVAEVKERTAELDLDQMRNALLTEKNRLSEGMQEHSVLSDSLPSAHSKLNEVQTKYLRNVDDIKKQFGALHKEYSEVEAKLKASVNKCAELKRKVRNLEKELADLQIQENEGQRKIEELRGTGLVPDHIYGSFLLIYNPE